jgi:hypothetical protein
MQITSLEVENVKRLKAVKITPHGDAVIIGGRNAQGKSSVLDSIEMALGGKDSIPEVPIRKGQKSARVILQLDGDDGGIVVTRRFTEKDSYIDIKRADGSKVGAPQALLDSLCNRVAFDPLSWIRAKPAEQAETLRKLVGIDFRPLDAKRKEAYDRRTDYNRDAKREAAAAEALPVVDAPDEPVSVADLMAELRRRQDQNRDIEARKSRHAEQLKVLQIISADSDKIEAEIARLQARLVELQEREARGNAWIDKDAEEIRQMAPADTAAIELQIADSEAINNRVRIKRDRAQRFKAADDFTRKADACTAAIEAIDDQKAAALAAAQWPIPGLGFDGEGVTFQGVPLDQASSAEQTRIAVAIGLALNPKLPVVLIRDGSLLDDTSLAAVAEQAKAAGAQVWIERVGKGAECSVVIEDGEVIQ